MVEEKEKISVKEFKAWLVGLIRGKRGAIPDLDDWKQIKAMMDKIDDEPPAPVAIPMTPVPAREDRNPWEWDPYKTAPWKPFGPYEINPNDGMKRYPMWTDNTGDPLPEQTWTGDKFEFIPQGGVISDNTTKVFVGPGEPVPDAFVGPGDFSRTKTWVATSMTFGSDGVSCSDEFLMTSSNVTDEEAKVVTFEDLKILFQDWAEIPWQEKET